MIAATAGTAGSAGREGRMAVTDGDHGDAAQRYRQMVENLRRRHPDWMIMYGTYSQMFWAFPLFTAFPGHYVGAAIQRSWIAR